MRNALADLLAAPWSIRLALLVAVAALAASVATDVRGRRIPNAVTLPALVAILGLSGVAGGWPLVENSLTGAAACAGPFLLAALPGWIGMGDVKLMAVSGAAAGWPGGVTVLLFVALAGGLQALVQLVWARVHGEERPRYLPYACAIAAGTLAAFVVG
jgi:Flp pilus assembly protein protease CpaA